jgi:hypothetical protein
MTGEFRTRLDAPQVPQRWWQRLLRRRPKPLPLTGRDVVIRAQMSAPRGGATVDVRVSQDGTVFATRTIDLLGGDFQWVEVHLTPEEIAEADALNLSGRGPLVGITVRA